MNLIQPQAFKTHQYDSIKDAFQYGLNEEYWRFGITLNQGNGWSVTNEECVRRLTYIRARLARDIFGNRWRAKAKIIFLVFKHGTKQASDVHFHALMAIIG